MEPVARGGAQAAVAKRITSMLDQVRGIDALVPFSLWALDGLLASGCFWSADETVRQVALHRPCWVPGFVPHQGHGLFPFFLKNLYLREAVLSPYS
jgi:hypothetical protein